ncbi:hypothetical protein MP228_008699 [Amoeboaphelidium protococcarum]|nr:hypothetical protein MP228_008699 [Amoeboaphelidium protococcarum]
MKNLFAVSNEIIQYGDLVFLYSTPQNMYPVQMQVGKTFGTQVAYYPHHQIVGKRFGSVIKAANGKQTLYALKPTCELWTRVLPHRTQIVYHTDAAVIIQNLNLQPGSVVVESGTGSASLTHYFSSVVGDEGRVYTFEYHEKRAETARLELEQHGLSHNVVVTHRDVCQDGFAIDSNIDDQDALSTRNRRVDAVFLDLPEPWRALGHAKSLMKYNARVCCFSPCIEQVQKTVQAMAQLNFIDMKTVECLEQSHKVEQETIHNVEDIVYGRTSSVDQTKKHIIVTKPAYREFKGHTAFLTFATMYE